MHYYLSLGSNLGDREATLRAALEHIEQQIGPITRCSSFFFSEPWGFESPNMFCNLCCCVETMMEPMDVLAAAQAIERILGRTHKSANGQYSDRPIDIDIIRAFDNAQKEIVSNDPLLTIPHPLYKQRDFVVIPLREIGGE